MLKAISSVANFFVFYDEVSLVTWLLNRSFIPISFTNLSTQASLLQYRTLAFCNFTPTEVKVRNWKHYNQIWWLKFCIFLEVTQSCKYTILSRLLLLLKFIQKLIHILSINRFYIKYNLYFKDKPVFGALIGTKKKTPYAWESTGNLPCPQYFQQNYRLFLIGLNCLA